VSELRERGWVVREGCVVVRGSESEGCEVRVGGVRVDVKKERNKVRGFEELEWLCVKVGEKVVMNLERIGEDGERVWLRFCGVSVMMKRDCRLLGSDGYCEGSEEKCEGFEKCERCGKGVVVRWNGGVVGDVNGEVWISERVNVWGK